MNIKLGFLAALPISTCHELVYYEEIQGMASAIEREKQLKNWKREWKIELIQSVNPEMKDLSAGWFNENDY
jgi:predicted GIY-YIG superfamily endonuclease